MRESTAAWRIVTHSRQGLLLLYDECVMMVNIGRMLIFLFVFRFIVNYFELFGF